MTMGFCENCGAKLNDTAKYCPSCGAQTPLGLVYDNENQEESITNDKVQEPDEELKLDNEQDFDDEGQLNDNGGEYYDEEERPKKRGCLKKILYAFAILAFIGFLSEKCGNKTDKGDGANDSIQQPTEQVATEAVEAIEADDAVYDTITKDVEEQPSELSSKEKEIADAGAHQGSLFGMAGANNEGFANIHDASDYMGEMGDKYNEMLEEMAGAEYDKAYNSPTNSEEERLRKIYIEHFLKAFNSAMDAMSN